MGSHLAPSPRPHDSPLHSTDDPRRFVFIAREFSAFSPWGTALMIHSALLEYQTWKRSPAVSLTSDTTCHGTMEKFDRYDLIDVRETGHIRSSSNSQPRGGLRRVHSAIRW